MIDAGTRYVSSLDARSDAILEACTACGACVRACPTPKYTGTDVTDPEAVARGVLEILRTGVGPDNSEAWAADCCGSGQCLTVCEHGINPRFMLTMARRAMLSKRDVTHRKAEGKTAFQTMSRGVRVMSRLQLPRTLMERLNPSSHPERQTPPEIVFYTGCNMLKTPHIGLLCLDVFDRLGVSYAVYGGPSNCCGILQLRPGDTASAGRQIIRTVDRFAATGAGAVVSWCPTCQIQLSETALPSDAEGHPFDTLMLPVFLASRLDDLRPMMTESVNERVALHEFPGSPGVVDAVKALLGAVPGLDLVDIQHPNVGYQLTSLNGIKDVQLGHIAGTFRQAEAAGVTALAGIFHADHRELVAHENQWPFKIVNYMDLIGASMGLNRPDLLKRFKLMQDADAILAATQDMIDLHNLDPEEVRDVIINDLLADQHLPIDRAKHPGAAAT